MITCITKNFKSLNQTIYNHFIDSLELHTLSCSCTGLVFWTHFAAVGIESMERLNDLLRVRFQFSPAMFGFVQGMNNDLLYALTFRNRETSRHVFQLLPDKQPAVSKEGQGWRCYERKTEQQPQVREACQLLFFLCFWCRALLIPLIMRWALLGAGAGLCSVVYKSHIICQY